MLEIKVLPLSVVAIRGTPNRAIHPLVMAVEQLAAVATGIGSASNQRVVLSKMVKRYRIPSEIGNGPTMSI